MATVHDATYEVLRSLGMTTIFGNPGSNELPFLDRLPSDFRYVLALHEGAGLAMADGYCQVTGRPVLVSLHAAAGVGQAMGTLVNAQVLGTPLVIMSGQQVRSMLTLEGQLTSRNAIDLPRPLVKWAFEAPDAASVPAVIARAAHFAAAAPSGPVFVSIPLDDWRAEANDDQTSSLIGRHVAAQPIPQQDQLRALADRLNAAQNPLFVMGSDVDTELGWKAGVKLSEICGAPVFLVSEPARISFPNQPSEFSRYPQHDDLQSLRATDRLRSRGRLWRSGVSLSRVDAGSLPAKRHSVGYGHRRRGPGGACAHGRRDRRRSGRRDGAVDPAHQANASEDPAEESLLRAFLPAVRKLRSKSSIESWPVFAHPKLYSQRNLHPLAPGGKRLLSLDQRASSAARVAVWALRFQPRWVSVLPTESAQWLLWSAMGRQTTASPVCGPQRSTICRAPS